MATLNFFRNVHIVDPQFFDEGPRLIDTKPTYRPGEFVNTSSIDTGPINAWRQGVELTHQKHFDAGVVKIHAGEPGHELRRNGFGMGKTYGFTRTFEELDYFDPKNFIDAQDDDSPLWVNIITFPIITSDNDHIENYVFDGVIEPLTIRSKASFFSIDVPFEAHDVRGAVMSANSDQTSASDFVLTVYETKQIETSPFMDQYASTVSFPEQQESVAASSAVGFFKYEKSQLTPFDDKRLVRNVTSQNTYDQTMTSAMSLMTGSTDDYVNTTLSKKSATSGWCYDNTVIQGTDSLSFGGMAY